MTYSDSFKARLLEAYPDEAEVINNLNGREPGVIGRFLLEEMKMTFSPEMAIWLIKMGHVEVLEEELCCMAQAEKFYNEWRGLLSNHSTSSH